MHVLGLAFLADKLPTRLLLTTYYGINLCESGEISWIFILLKTKFLVIDVGFWKLQKKKRKEKKKEKRKKKDTLDLTMCPKLGLLGSSFTETGDEMRSQ